MGMLLNELPPAAPRHPGCGWSTRLAGGLLLVLGVLLGGCVTQQDRQALQQGYDDYNAHRYAAAAQAANTYIDKFPHDEDVGEAYYLRALTELTANERTQARTDLAAAIAATKRADLQARSERVLGDLAFEDDHYAEAIRYYQSALAADPASPEAQTYYRLGCSLQAIGQWAEARAPLARVLSMPDNGGWDDYARRRLGATAFALQFGAYRDLAPARTLALGLRRAGVQADVFRELRGTAPLYTVRFGHYLTLPEVESARQAMLARYPQVAIYP